MFGKIQDTVLAGGTIWAPLKWTLPARGHIHFHQPYSPENWPGPWVPAVTHLRHVMRHSCTAQLLMQKKLSLCWAISKRSFYSDPVLPTVGLQPIEQTEYITILVADFCCLYTPTLIWDCRAELLAWRSFNTWGKIVRGVRVIIHHSHSFIISGAVLTNTQDEPFAQVISLYGFQL